MRKIDVATISPSSITVMSYFAATLNLHATEAVNSSVDSHAWLDNFFVSHQRKVVLHMMDKDGQEEEKDMSINDCDIFQYFGSMSKGEKNAYVSHNACLKHIIEQYKHEFQEQNEELTYVIIWTDNCPNQCKCKDNFVHIVLIEEILGVYVIHCFDI